MGNRDTRVVKDKRRPVRSSPIMGKNGIALVEYIGHSLSLSEFTVEEENGNKQSYMFSARPAHKTQFVDKAHGDYLVTIKGDDGQDLFRIITQYATAAYKKRLEINLPSEIAQLDDLPSGFAPREGLGLVAT